MAGRWRSEGKVESFGLRYKTDKTLGDSRNLKNKWGPIETFFSYQYFLSKQRAELKTLAVEDKVLNIFGDATHVAVWRRRPLDSEQEGVQSAVASQKLVQLVFGADLIENFLLKVPNDFKPKKLAE